MSKRQQKQSRSRLQKKLYYWLKSKNLVNHVMKQKVLVNLAQSELGFVFPPGLSIIEKMAALCDEIGEFKFPSRTQQKKARQAKRKSSKDFYTSEAWQRLRYQTLTANRVHHGRLTCECCCAFDCMMHVDHIKPRSKYPERELDPSNLQILCEDCNLGKSNWDETDWREPALAVLMGERMK